MTGSSLAALPGCMTRPHKAQTVPPSSFFSAPPFAGRLPLLRWLAIETESDFARGVVPRVFLEIDGDSTKSFFLSGLNRELIEPKNC